MKNFMTLVLLGGALLTITACQETQGNTEADSTQHSATTDNSSQTNKEEHNLDPEENPNSTATSVLKFKLRESTTYSVKKSLLDYEELPNSSYAGGSIINSDGKSFDLKGLYATQFGFDKDNNLSYVYMKIKEENPMEYATFDKVVGYIKDKGHQLIKEERPFVGDQLAIFSTSNNETITVSLLHLGDFSIEVEYLTNEFKDQRNKQRSNDSENQKTKESQNF